MADILKYYNNSHEHIYLIESSLEAEFNNGCQEYIFETCLGYRVIITLVNDKLLKRNYKKIKFVIETDKKFVIRGGENILVLNEPDIESIENDKGYAKITLRINNYELEKYDGECKYDAEVIANG